jgi:hypothetical protein
MSECNVCHRQFISGEGNVHLRRYHKHENLSRCSYLLCTTFFRTKEDQLRHERETHQTSNRMKCVVCGMYIIKSIISCHMRKYHNLKSEFPKAFKCTSNCNEYFVTEAERNKHVSSVHEKNLVRKEVKCIYCSKMCMDESVLSGHIGKCHSHVKLRCKIVSCKQYFHTVAQKNAHFKEHNLENEKKQKFKCLKCSFRSSSDTTLKEHFRNLHGSRDVPCPKCPNFFTCKRALNHHLRSSHTVPLLCQHCNKMFLRLRQHKKKGVCKKCQTVLPCKGISQLHYKICQ